MDTAQVDELLFVDAPIYMILVTIFVLVGSRDRFRSLPREPTTVRELHRNGLMRRILYGGTHNCTEYIRMNSTTFFKLSCLLRDRGLLRDTIHLSVEEQLAMFLHTIGHHSRNRVMKTVFVRSGSTVSRYFNAVLRAICAIRDDYVRQPGTETHPCISSNPIYAPYFKDCIGFLDGTHIAARVPSTHVAKFRGRKGVTQNVLAACDCDLKFVYVLAGWEGSANDFLVLKDALSRPSPANLRVPEGTMANSGKRPLGTESGSSSVASKKKGTPNKRWTKEMDDVLIPFLAEMARGGLKVDKSFKRQAFVEAATLINSRFTLPAKMDADNVENHMRTIKQRYQELKKVMDLSGVGWNEEKKMFVLEDETLRTFVEAHPKSKEWLNKPINNLEELRLICGDDQATGQFSRSIYENFGVGDNEGVNETEPDFEDMDATPTEQASQPIETPRVSVSTPTVSRGSRTSRATFDSAIEEIAKGMGELTSTLRESKIHWIENLSTVLFSMDDEYTEEELERAYDHLRGNEGDARGFMHRRPGMRKKWMDSFLGR